MKKITCLILVFVFLFTVSSQCFANNDQGMIKSTKETGSSNQQMPQKKTDKWFIVSMVSLAVASIAMIVMMANQQHHHQHEHED